MRTLARTLSVLTLALAAATLPALRGEAAPSGAEAQPPATSAAPCPVLDFKLGPAFEVKASDGLWLDPTHERLRVESGEETFAYDLSRSQEVSVKEREAPTASRTVHAKAAPPSRADEGRPLRLAEAAVTLPNGRGLALSRLYAGIYVLKVGPAERDRYASFTRDLLAGKACGQPFAALTAELKAKLKPAVTYALFDAISSGQLDDLAAWTAYRPVFAAFLSLKEIEDFLEIYGYRASERGRALPGLERLDPNKLWTFAWNAAARLFDDPDYTVFSDLSAFQRDGRVTFTLIGSEPIPEGQGNRYGFYTKPAGEIASATVTADQPMRWSWRQGEVEYLGALEIAPAPRPRPTDRFSGAKNGLIVLDVTLDKEDVIALRDDYAAYFTALGYQFGAAEPVADVSAYVTGAIADHALDMLVRDGHADGDDTHAMVLYPTGFHVAGQRRVGTRLDTIDIVFNLDPNARNMRLAYGDFAAAVASRFGRMGRPLTFLDGSCWGVEKAWFTLGQIPPAQMVEVASDSPVNFFEDDDRSAMRMVLDGIVKGSTFASVRARLATLPSVRSGREDGFVLPDDRRHPLSGPFLRIAPQIFRRQPGEDMRPYTPDGYV